MKKIFVTLAALALVAALAVSLAAGGDNCSSCNSSKKTGSAPADKVGTAANPLKQTYDSPAPKVGDVVWCPVFTTVKITVAEKSKSVDVNGKKYYVCCGHCEKEVKATPDKYLKPKA